MKIVIPHPLAIPDAALDTLRTLGAKIYDSAPSTPADVKERIADAEIITTRSLTDSPDFNTTAEIIDAAPHLRYIVTPTTGYNHIDTAYAATKGIQVLNCATFNSQAVAEHALSLLLAVNRCLGEGDARLRDGRWDQSDLTGYELAGKHVGLIGHGHVGTIIEKLVQGLGMTTSFTRSHSSEAEIDTLFETSDYIIVCAPLTDATKHMINEKRLTQMKSSAVLVNVARGPIVDQAALLTALKSKSIRGAALDVYDNEPDSAQAPADIVEIAQLPNTVVTPHIAYFTHEARLKLGNEIIDDIKSCVDNKPINLVG